MGLFSFLKKAGSNLFGKDVETKAEEAAKELEARNALLINEINKLNFDVQDLSLNLDDDTVTVYGKVDSQDEKEKDRKSTRLNSSHVKKSYAVFCLKKKITPA